MRKILHALVISTAMGVSLSQVPVAMAEDKAAGMEKMLIEISSPLAFDETLAKLESNAKSQGWKVPGKWKVNFQKNLLKVTGVDIGKNQVIKMCEPRAAAELLVHDEYKMLTAMMPCTIAVYEKSDGKTYVSMMNLEVMGKMYGGAVQDMVKDLAPQMAEMLKL